MIRFLFLCIALIISLSLNGIAQITYRGFIEGGLGITTVAGASKSEEFGNANNGGGIGLGYMLATTYGIQFKNNFFGIGVGMTPGYCANGDYRKEYDYYNSEKTIEVISPARISRVSFPLYFNWRYDFFNTNGSFNPFIGAKIGAFLTIPKLEINCMETDSRIENYISYYGEETDGFPFFVAIDLGLRKRLSESSGLSFGLSVQTSRNAHMNPHYDGYWNFWLYDRYGINIIANIAYDF